MKAVVEKEKDDLERKAGDTRACPRTGPRTSPRTGDLHPVRGRIARPFHRRETVACETVVHPRTAPSYLVLVCNGPSCVALLRRCTMQEHQEKVESERKEWSRRARAKNAIPAPRIGDGPEYGHLAEMAARGGPEVSKELREDCTLSRRPRHHSCPAAMHRHA